MSEWEEVKYDWRRVSWLNVHKCVRVCVCTYMVYLYRWRHSLLRPHRHNVICYALSASLSPAIVMRDVSAMDLFQCSKFPQATFVHLNS